MQKMSPAKETTILPADVRLLQEQNIQKDIIWQKEWFKSLQTHIDWSRTVHRTISTYNPITVLNNKDYKLYWDIEIRTNKINSMQQAGHRFPRQKKTN